MNMNLTQQTGNNRSKRIPVLAAGIALALCLVAVVVVRFQPYDPSVPAENESFLDYALLAGVWLVPFASVCFAKRLFEGRRFRFALSWLVGFLIPWLLLVYETYFPHTPPEDHEYFKRVNPQISPNPVVEEIFTEYIENGYLDEPR